jgi:hypothetical protein
MEYETDSDESISRAVVAITSRVENTAINDLPPLYESIDPDKLDTMFAKQAHVHVSFGYSDSLIDIYNGEYLRAETT